VLSTHKRKRITK